MLRKSKIQYLRTLASSKTDSKSIWKAINKLTNKSSHEKSFSIKDITLDNLNQHFASVAEKTILNDKSSLNDLKPLQEFLNSKNISDNLSIPFMAVFEVYDLLLKLKDTRLRTRRN